MEQKTASLHAITHDHDSAKTLRSDTMSKLSKSFTFDRELLGTKVYEQGYRKSLRLWRSKTSTTLKMATSHAVERTSDLHLDDITRPNHRYVDSGCQTDSSTDLSTDCNKKIVRTRISHTSLSGDTIYLDADTQEDPQWQHAPAYPRKEQQSLLPGVVQAVV